MCPLENCFIVHHRHIYAETIAHLSFHQSCPPVLQIPSALHNSITISLRLELGNSLIELLVDLHDDNWSSLLVDTRELRSQVLAESVRSVLGLLEGVDDERGSRETEKGSVELRLVLDEVVKEGVDVWLEVENLAGNGGALAVGQRSGHLGGGGGVVDGLGDIGGLDLDGEGGDGVLVLVEGVEGVVQGGDVAIDVVDGVADGGAITLLELRWEGKGQGWQEEEAGEHVCGCGWLIVELVFVLTDVVVVDVRF